MVQPMSRRRLFHMALALVLVAAILVYQRLNPPVTAEMDIGQRHAAVTDCPDAQDWEMFGRCADANLARLQEAGAVPAPATDAVNAYFYRKLGELPPGAGKEDTIVQQRLRSQLGEWLYFALPAFAGTTPPVDYAKIDPRAFWVEAYRLPDESYMLVYWQYLGAQQASYGIARLEPSGALRPMRMERFDGEGTPLVIENASVPEYIFTQLDAKLEISARDGDQWLIRRYLLDGDLFVLQEVLSLSPDDQGQPAETETLIYKRNP